MSDLYIDKKTNTLIKKFEEKPTSINLEDCPIKEIFKREVKALKEMDKIKQYGVKTPTIYEVDNKNLIYKQRFFNIEGFYKYMIKNQFNKYTYKILYKFGIFLAKYHLQSKRIHGDLNRKNIGFFKRAIFVYDPTYLKYLYTKSYYYDLVRFIYNFYPYNPFNTI